MNKPLQTGFTLIEMAIVLIVVGLLVGGILAGRNMIASADLKAVMTDIDIYATAAASFQNKYNALPGDITTATGMWGAAHGTFNTCKTTVGAGITTCNGDGNGLIGNVSTAAADGYESFRAWQHMKNAGFITGPFSGVLAGGSNPETNVPKTSFGGGLSIYYLTAQSASGSYFDGNYGHVLTVGAATAGHMVAPLISPEEAQEVDNKLDNKMPGSGKIMSFKFTI